MDHHVYMRRCLQLSRNGQYTASPNPMVGSVIVKDGRIIGEGWHHKAGEAHAEVRAIASVKDKDQLRNSTLYVNLEPCAHYGRTPPCAELIVEMQIPRVVIGCRDPFAEVSGKGIEKLQAAGVEVIFPLMEEECRQLNKKFFTFQEKQRPFITLKWAQTADGFIDRIRQAGDQGQFLISGARAQVYVHHLRAAHQAILVGYRTVINDDPSLNVRWPAAEDPIIFIIDPELKITDQSKVFRSPARVVIFNNHLTEVRDKREYVRCDKEIPATILRYCRTHNIQSVLVEGGAATHRGFIKAGLWDEIQMVEAPGTLGKGLPSPTLPQAPHFAGLLGKDKLYILENK